MASNPDIPSFKNPSEGEPKKDGEKKEEEKKGGALASGAAAKEEKKAGGPSLFGRASSGPAPKSTGFGSSPALKVRGLSGGPKTLFDRLKQFQKKDLIFIASGLGVLFMAPLAEHFMMNPAPDNRITKGFDDKSGSGSGLGPGPGVAEPGTGGMSPGGLVGASSDIITPLNVRDPSALVMAPGASQVTPPPAAATVAPAAAGASRDNSWKDALATAAKEGASKGAEAGKPSAFKAPGAIAGALRGLSALSGGSYGGGPSFNLSAPNASNVPNRPGESSRLSQVQAAPGYKGVGQRGLDSGGNAEALRKAAENAGNQFNRPGGAAGSLEAAAKEAIPTGSASNGGGGANGGGENKGGSGSNTKDNKAIGESLAFMKAKMEMEKAVDLEWSIKKWKEFEFPKMIYEDITKSAITNILGNGLFVPLGKSMAKTFASASGASTGVQCSNGDGTSQQYLNNGNTSFTCQTYQPGQVVQQPLDQTGQPTGYPTPVTGGTTGIKCDICTPMGGNPAAGGAKTPPPAGGVTSAPTTADPRNQQQGADQSRSAAKGSLQQFCGDQNATPPCSACQANTGIADKSVCQYAANALRNFDALDQAAQQLKDATTDKEKAWGQLQSAVQQYKAAIGAMNAALTGTNGQGATLGAPPKGQDGSALKAAQDAYDALLKTPPDSSNLSTNLQAVKTQTAAGNTAINALQDAALKDAKSAVGDQNGGAIKLVNDGKALVIQAWQAVDGVQKSPPPVVAAASAYPSTSRIAGDLQRESQSLKDQIGTLAGAAIKSSGSGDLDPQSQLGAVLKAVGDSVAPGAALVCGTGANCVNPNWPPPTAAPQQPAQPNSDALTKSLAASSAGSALQQIGAVDSSDATAAKTSLGTLLPGDNPPTGAGAGPPNAKAQLGDMQTAVNSAQTYFNGANITGLPTK